MHMWLCPIISFSVVQNIFQFVDNQEYFGHLINAESYAFNHLHPDLWQLFDNPLVGSH